MALTRFTPRVVAACASLGIVALTGCGSSTTDASGDEIASLQTDSGTDASTDTTVDADGAASADEVALEFSQCLRDQGLDVADIGVDADGNIDLRSAFDSVDPGDGEFRSAMDACSDILGDVGFGGGARGGDFDDTALQDAFLEFSDCVRDQGFEDIPDLSFQAPGGGRPGGDGEGGPPPDGSIPQPGEGERPDGFGDRNTIFAEGLGLDPEDPTVVAALDECSPLIEGAFGGPDGGPAGGDAES
jgi:hypothetical protein